MATTTDIPRGQLRRKTAPPAALRLAIEDLARLPDATAVQVLKAGLPSKFVRELANRLGLSLDGFTGPLQLTSRTLHRRMQEGVLTQAESERLLALVRTFFRAVHLLGNEEKAAHWLKSRPPVLLGKAPLEVMDTWLGMQQVEALLSRMHDGAYS